MAGDRIKITEMPIAATLNGLRTYGVDENNADVQVPINLLKGNEGKSAYEAYLETTTEVPPKTEAEFNTILGSIGEITDEAELATIAANTAAANAQNVADTYATELANKVSKTGDETINGVKDFVSSPLVPTPTQNGEAANKAYADTKIAKVSITPDFGSDTEKVISQKGYTDDMKAWLPSSVYSDRVTADSGTIRDKSLLNAMYDDALNLLPNTDLWYNFECGIKTRVSGLNTYVTKVYDLSSNNRDATQATEASQPYLVSNINPANRLAIWGALGRILNYSQLAKLSTDKWSLEVIGKPLGNSPVCFTVGGGSVYVNHNLVNFNNSEEVGANQLHGEAIVGTCNRFILVAKGDGTLQYWRNGKLISTMGLATSIIFSNIYIENIELKSLRLFNKDLNKSEIEFLDAKMSAFYPQFEGVEIGNQVWEASNMMDITAPDGSVFSFEENSAIWASATFPAWCYPDNNEATGAVYGRLYNAYAVQKLTGSPIWRAPMSADYDQLSTFLGGNAVAGGKMKAEGLTYWLSPNTGATNESGFTALAGNYRSENGPFSSLLMNSTFATHDQAVWVTGFNYSDFDVATFNYKTNRGYAVRRLRRVPPGANIREITSGVFSFPITGGAFKDIAIPNMYKITGVKITSANALTNIVLEIRTSAGVLVQNIMSGKSHDGSGKTILYSSILYDAEAMLQDYIVRATAVGNGGAGMEIELIIEKIKV